MRRGFLLSILVLACGSSAAARPEPAVGAGSTASAGAREVPAVVASAVSTHCGGCHDSARSSDREPLEVFDVAEEDWFEGLSTRQWKGFSERLEPKVDASERPAVQRFVARRRAAVDEG